MVLDAGEVLVDLELVVEFVSPHLIGSLERLGREASRAVDVRRVADAISDALADVEDDDQVMPVGQVA